MKRVSLLLSLLLLAAPALADEGMWTPDQVPDLAKVLKPLGLKIDPGKMASLLDHPMNAVVSLGGCTASFVSPEGLVVTNHHCAYGAIQFNSTEERNLLDQGFLAGSREEELFAGPGSRVLVTEEVRDVTDKVLGGIKADVRGKARYDAIDKREKELIADCEKADGYRCNVYSFHGGLQYKLIKQLEIKDVRLVHAPAGSVGKFGGDIDNWMWPRHTGDYSFYRAYVGKDGRPADHDAANVPYRPKHYLRIATDPLREGDLVLVAGYPGSTNRYRMADEVANAFGWRYPKRKAMFERMLDVIERKTAERPDAELKYASLIAGLNNASKNYQGQMEGFERSDILDRKRQQEDALKEWLRKGGETREEFLAAIRTLEELVQKAETTQERDLYYGGLGFTSMVGTARRLYRLSAEREKPDADREQGYQERDLQRITERLTRMERTFDPQVDRALLRQMLLDYAALVPPDQRVQALDRWFGIRGTEVDETALDARLAEMYAGTRLGDTEIRIGWMEKSREEMEASDDPFLQLAVALFPEDMALEDEDEDLGGLFQEYRPRYMAAMTSFLQDQGKVVYPDANGTLRVTYGTVTGYSPRDGMRYTPFTTVEGVLAKETGEEPFNSPPELLAAIREGRRGPFADDALGTVPVNFLSTVDTTGGNSGSPTLNGKGELVGLLFDGTYDSINADWFFNPDLNRSIHVDMRYVLWVMEEVAGAERLMKEIGLTPPKRAAR